jgi:hypothetical protein
LKNILSVSTYTKKTLNTTLKIIKKEKFTQKYIAVISPKNEMNQSLEEMI